MKSQLQRILKSDLSDYKIAVTEHINNLDHLEECLTERSAFMQNFNQLLKQELERFNKEPPTEFDAIELRRQERKEIARPSPHFQKENKSIGSHFHRKESLIKLLNDLSLVQKFVQRSKIEIEAKVESTRALIMKDLNKSIINIVESVNKVYESKVNLLERQIDSLREQNLNLKKEKETVKAFPPKIEIRPSNYESKHWERREPQFDYSPIQSFERVNTVNVFADDKVSQLQTQRQCTESLHKLFPDQSYFKSNVYESEKFPKEMTLKNNNEVNWKHYVCDLEHTTLKEVKESQREGKENNSVFNGPSKTKESYRQVCQPGFPVLLRKNFADKAYDVPAVRALVVSYPPIKEGFSALKLGNEVVYRGMWKLRKFHGKGKLCMPEYSYEGDFQYGLFHGRGTLKIGNLQYIGQFVDNKAEGEGKLKIGAKMVSGRWRSNVLTQKY